MRIDGSPLFADMASMMREAQGPATPTAGGLSLSELGLGSKGISEVQAPLSPAADRFAVMLKSALDNVNGLQQTSSSLQTRFDMGDRSISLSDVMIASQKSSIAFNATIQVRNKLVEAYKEIMNMPV